MMMLFTSASYLKEPYCHVADGLFFEFENLKQKIKNKTKQKVTFLIFF